MATFSEIWADYNAGELDADLVKAGELAGEGTGTHKLSHEYQRAFCRAVKNIIIGKTKVQ